jgi:hypothetical protein
MCAVWPPEQLASLYRDMYLIRRFEERRAVRSRHSAALPRWIDFAHTVRERASAARRGSPLPSYM